MSVLNYYSRQFGITFEMVRNLFVPRKKESLLYFEEIGLTLAVPGFLTILSNKQMTARLKKQVQMRDAHTPPFATGDDCRQLFIARSAEYYYMSGLMILLGDRRPIDAKNEYYEFEHSLMNEMKERYKDYAKVVIEEHSVGVVISGIDFEKAEIMVWASGEVIYSIYYYHGFYKGYQVLLSASFSEGRRGVELVKSIEKARFS